MACKIRAPPDNRSPFYAQSPSLQNLNYKFSNQCYIRRTGTATAICHVEQFCLLPCIEYHFFRIEELKIKIKLDKKIKGMNTNIKKLQKTLPKLELPHILRKEGQEKTEFTFKNIKSSEENIEEQLREIQKRLNELQR